jgi:fatty-acyl-CoA synthase
MPRTDWFQKWARYSPHKMAVNSPLDKRSYTYLELHQKGEALAQYLYHEKGLRKGDRLAVLADFDLNYILLFAALQKLGFVLVPLNYRLTTRELEHLLKDSEPALLIYQSQFLAKVEAVRSHYAHADWSELEQWVQGPRQSFPLTEHPDFEDAAFILYTSGSTGLPKGALYTHQMMFWNSVNTALRLSITQADHTLMVMPPFHAGGWNVLTTPLLHVGGSVSLLPRFEPDLVLNLIEEEQVTIFMAVPTMVRMLTESPLFDKISLKSLRNFVVGGEALAIPLIEQWAAKKVLIRQGYGLTEVGTNVTSLPAEDAIRKRGSIGFPNFYLETKLVKEDGTEAGVNEIGELWLKGPVVTPGYWRLPEATAKSFEGPWFKTGDLLREDEEGYLYVVDRIKNMFISGGENVYPAEVEAFLIDHPDIVEVAVVGIPDPQWGEVGKAVYVAAQEIPTAELKEYCQGGLARYKVPKQFVWMAELPKTDSGKIDKKNLR